MERIDPDQQADERTTLGQFLDLQRATMLMKLEGLGRADAARPHPPTTLTLVGLAKHLALNEDSWFQEVFLGRPLPEPWASAPFDEDPDWELHSAVDDEPGAVAALYREACARSRAVLAEAPSLDELSVEASRRDGRAFSLRWIVLHMIEETARHVGHADLLREAIDGAVGE